MSEQFYVICWILFINIFTCTLTFFNSKKRFNTISRTIIILSYFIVSTSLNIYFLYNKTIKDLEYLYFFTLIIPSIPIMLLTTKSGIISIITISFNIFLAVYSVMVLKDITARYIIKNTEWVEIIPVILFPMVWIYVKYFYLDFQNDIDDTSSKFSLILMLFGLTVTLELVLYTYLAKIVGQAFLRTDLFCIALLSVYFFSYLIFKPLFKLYTNELVNITNTEIFNKEALHIEERLESSQKNEAKLKVLKHDLKHILVTVNQLITNDKIEEASNYLQEYTNKIDNITISSYSTNPIIDSVLGYYMSYCEKNDIEFKIQIDDFENILNIPTLDFSVFISNCLENAVNATKKLHKNRKISLSIINNRQRLVLQIKNTFNGKIKFGGDNTPISNKKNHGIGTTSIKWFVDKYHLDINYIIEKNNFIINILLNDDNK
ncbi:MAG: GHKL domain-containing protein [Bacilli bacterium]|nr:GHKL domain-containing protein [Bacilli bacterium]